MNCDPVQIETINLDRIEAEAVELFQSITAS
jgi:hypothetical protein